VDQDGVAAVVVAERLLTGIVLVALLFTEVLVAAADLIPGLVLLVGLQYSVVMVGPGPLLLTWLPLALSPVVAEAGQRGLILARAVTARR